MTFYSENSRATLIIEYIYTYILFYQSRKTIFLSLNLGDMHIQARILSIKISAEYTVKN